MSDKQSPEVIGIAAGKGGVGKSALTVHLAYLLQQKGLKVGVLDADIYGPSIAKMLPFDVPPMQSKIDPEKILPALAKEIRVISMAYFRGQREPSIVRAPIANAAIGQFLECVEWGDLDVLFIDFPPGTGDIQLTLLQKGNITGALLITTPQEVAVLDVSKALQMFLAMQIPLLGVVENMSYWIDPTSGQRHYPLGEGGGERLARDYKIPLLGKIPLDAALSSAGDLGQVVFASCKESPSAVALLQVADALYARLRKFGAPSIIGVQIEGPLLTLQWNGGGVLITRHRLSLLQSHCPCVHCRAAPKSAADGDVGATEAVLVGRYAVQIAFTRGCSQGIYPLALLKELRE